MKEEIDKFNEALKDQSHVSLDVNKWSLILNFFT